jgi:hypothetical protein
MDMSTVHTYIPVGKCYRFIELRSAIFRFKSYFILVANAE